MKYKIEFFSNWHCGSGLSAGVTADVIVVKDEHGLPFLPGKTVKGLLRHAVEELYSGDESIAKIFGEEGGVRVGKCFFSNATLPEGETIIKEKLTRHLYQNISSTAIDPKSGIAKENSLRSIETVVPCVLEGEILNVPTGGETMLKDAMQMIKRLGTGRNRGYGRCKISVIQE